MLEKLYKLFEKCEKERYRNNIKEDPVYALMPRAENLYKKRHDDFLKKLEKHEFGKTTSSGENLDAIKKYALSVEEASIIYMYTHHLIYGSVNSQLRNAPNNLQDDVREYSNLLNSALEKLPPFNNQTIYRDVKNPDPDVEASLKFYNKNIGSKITLSDYLSSHKSATRWSDDEYGFQMVIETSKNSNSRDLQYITFVQGEEEVIFISPTNFWIEKVDEENTTIYLKEV